MNETLRAHCKFLGFDQPPELAELKKAYKVLIKQCHPDRFHGQPRMEQLALEKTQRVNLAYQALLGELESAREDTGNSSVPPHTNVRHRYSWQAYSDGFPDASVTEFFLNSSHIVSAGYNKVRRLLYLKFLGDEVYLYFDVPVFIFDHLLHARSPGKYAMRFVYKRFRHRKFTPLIRSTFS